jgi:hypothetical protein
MTDQIAHDGFSLERERPSIQAGSLSRNRQGRSGSLIISRPQSVAISNRRLLQFDEAGVTFRYKDYRRTGAERQQVMTLSPDEFIRRFLLHTLPRGFHRIRHYGLLAGTTRKTSLERARLLLKVAPPAHDDAPADPPGVRPPCPCCGGQMIVIETFERRYQPRAPPSGIHASGSPAS